jgi:hypothetical protein
LATLLAFACGGRSTERQDASPSPPDPIAPDPIAKGGSSEGSAGAANQIPPLPEPSTGGAESTAGGGADSTDPCAGVEPSCAPGEPICDPILGVTATCGECGEPRPNEDATPCIRLIASDKESNYVCVVRGATELQCWPNWSNTAPGVVSAQTREVLLPDDGASLPQGELMAPCVRTGVSAYSCFPGAENLSRVAIGDSGACALGNGKLFCGQGIVMPAALPDPIVDISITDNNLVVLGATGVAINDQPPHLPDFWQGTPRQVRVDHELSGCMFSTLNEMACWTGPGLPLRPSAWTGFRKWIPMTMPQACVLDARGRVGCGNVLEDAAPVLFDVERAVDLVASASLACALTREGRVLCWNAQGSPLELPAGW